ncbi:MAG: phage tail sheath C-terminal domain-containing protein [Balneolaceae bacterium]
MQNIKTPGVTIQEISKLPASVAPVATAVPAFIGYTEKSIRGKEEIPVNTPVEISSMLEYEEIFGSPFKEAFGISLTGPSTEPDDTSVEVTVPGSGLSPYRLYYNMRMYFANGGGRCYVVSVGKYKENPTSGAIDSDELKKGVDALETEDEPTLIVVPEATVLTDSGKRGGLYDRMRDQCAKLKDRFALMDVVEANDDDPIEDAKGFRGEIGMNNLNYGAAYYPALETSLRLSYLEESVQITDKRGEDGVGPFHDLVLTNVPEGSENARGKIVILDNNEVATNDVFTIGEDDFKVVDSGPGDNEFELGGTEKGTAQNLASAVSDNDDYEVNRISNTGVVLVTAKEPGEDGTSIALGFSGSEDGVEVSGSSLELEKPDKTLYNQINKELDKKRLTLYPASTLAGVYARVDRDRGVWKAPANVSLNLVDEPSVILTDEEQAPLNVDADTGKSVNAIRKFHQKGTIVWGARTLAGNDNEWRYVPVRRLFIFIEESIKKATEPVVFEPNVANTWSKTKAMIENFLTGLWRDGALAGATPEDAFYVKVGLGETMNSNDILEGRLIIEIGIAAVRPAEFIILQFMHKLQES